MEETTKAFPDGKRDMYNYWFAFLEDLFSEDAIDS